MTQVANPIKEEKDRRVEEPPKLEGWCTKQKALKLQELIRSHKPQILVEIGVFGGASFLPCAIELKNLCEKDPLYQPKFYGIDPWDNHIATQGWDSNHENHKWWKVVDLEKIKNDFLSCIQKYELESITSILQQPSTVAVSSFEDQSIGFIHIDGNHGVHAIEDVRLWTPKVKDGGIIVFDDANWPENQLALQELEKWATCMDGPSEWKVFLKNCKISRKSEY